MPHAWKGGAQIAAAPPAQAMDDGDVVGMAVSASRRCPPGALRGASLIAYYLKTKKPKSKLLLLDARTSSRCAPVQHGRGQAYPDLSRGAA